MQVAIQRDEMDKITFRVKKYIKNDPVLQALLTASFDDIDNWVDNNINTMTDVRQALKRILRILYFTIKQEGK